MNTTQVYSKLNENDTKKTIVFEDRIAKQLPGWHERLSNLLNAYGDIPIGEVTVSKVYGGMRGIFGLVTEISHVDPTMGLLIRGYTIDELLDQLPKIDGSAIPLAGGLYYLLLVDDFPTLEDALYVESVWRERQGIPGYVIDLLKSMPADTHPMTLFSQAILALQPNSQAARAYHDGISRHEYWRPMLDDALNLTANLPALAAMVYNIKYRDGEVVDPDPDLDWSANFAHMIGKGHNEEYRELCRLFMTLHADQENGNASAHTAHLVGSTLSDLYLSCSAGLNALAGPLHGLASQETLRWLLAIQERYGRVPTHLELEQFAFETLSQGKVIPGYGHGVLRKTDSRFTAFYRFAEQYLPDDPLFRLVQRVYDVMPSVLQSTGKVNNPYPNVDAISATLQYHYGITQAEFCTVLFGASRLLGLSAHAVWARALGLSIERPRSLTTSKIEDMLTSKLSLNTAAPNLAQIQS